MRLDPRNDWLHGVRRIPSPNCDERPPGSHVELLVVHSISLPPGYYGGSGIEELFTNRLDPTAHPYFESIAGLRVSAHALIRRDGEIIQYVPFRRRAWHAGVSCYCGRSACNDFSIGIELEGTDSDAYEEVQYRRLAELARVLMQSWPEITLDRIVGHSDIAPGRKTDPGPGFDWARLRALLQGAG
jgi:AmpD protein